MTAGLADRAHKIELRGALARQILDQEHAGLVPQFPLDLRVAPEALGLLPDIEHRQRQPVGDPGGKRDSGRLAAGDRVEPLIPGMALDQFGPEIHQLGAGARERDQPPAIDINRRFPARGKGERVLRAEQHRIGFKQDARGDVGRLGFAGGTVAVLSGMSFRHG